MKRIIIMFIVVMLSVQITQAQGTIYVSNVGQTSTASLAVGSDSWLAAGFKTGGNANGYAINSIELAMADAYGNPNGFSVMIYAQNPLAVLPGSSLGSLSGSSNPSTTGIYTYTADSNIILSPYTIYFIVLIASTTVANGSYDWCLASANNYNLSDNWDGDAGYVHKSSNGSSWSSIPGAYPEFAINATAIPEPSAKILFGFGGILLLGFLSRRDGKCKS